MKKVIPLLFLICTSGLAQKVDFIKIPLGEFSMSNPSSPAFLLVDESPTAIYTPDNIKALMIHAMENLGKSISIEVNPYFFVNTKRSDRTYYKYMGIEAHPDGRAKQRPFSGLNTTSVSFAYVDKEFSGISGSKKTYSIGFRTTLLRFFDAEKLRQNAQDMGDVLSSFTVPTNVLVQGEEAIQKYYFENGRPLKEALAPFQKTIKPIFRIDAAMGYSALFKENTTSSGTVNRFGTWLTAEGNFILNDGNVESKGNHYCSFLLTARYIEDGFNLGQNEDYFNTFYRDFGAKLAFEFGKIGVAYEYISRKGSLNSERSVGTIRYMINKDVSITGGFGKDFPVDDNLVTLFGINWGFNVGENSIPVQ